MADLQLAEYHHSGAGLSFTFDYIGPVVFATLAANRLFGKRVFEVGCGDGEFAAVLAQRGYAVTAIDPSESGVRHANMKWPHLAIHQRSDQDDLAAEFGTFPFVMSFEVIEHVYAPRMFLRRIHDLLMPGGRAIISTPYHGYLKNLVMAATGALDNHFQAAADHGHIKFFSVPTLCALMRECGLEPLSVHRAGRIAPLAKSMVIVASRA